jgi:hypothetical protein
VRWRWGKTLTSIKETSCAARKQAEASGRFVVLYVIFFLRIVLSDLIENLVLFSTLRPDDGCEWQCRHAGQCKWPADYGSCRDILVRFVNREVLPLQMQLILRCLIRIKFVTEDLIAAPWTERDGHAVRADEFTLCVYGHHVKHV